jgi:hypothetical protein
MVVCDHETTSSDPPLRPAAIAPSRPVMLQQRRLEIESSEAKSLGLVERV